MPDDDKGAPKSAGATDRADLSTADLLAELGRRFRVRFGRVEIVFHDGRPSPRVTVEYRVLRGTDD